MQQTTLPTHKSNEDLLQWILAKQKEHMDAYRMLERMKQLLLQPKEQLTKQSPQQDPNLVVPSTSFDLHWGC